MTASDLAICVRVQCRFRRMSQWRTDSEPGLPVPIHGYSGHGWSASFRIAALSPVGPALSTATGQCLHGRPAVRPGLRTWDETMSLHGTQDIHCSQSFLIFLEMLVLCRVFYNEIDRDQHSCATTFSECLYQFKGFTVWLPIILLQRMDQ